MIDGRKSLSRVAAAAALALACLGAGCLQIDTTVSYHEDGSATVTERVNLSRVLLDMASAEGSGKPLTALLEKPAVLARMNQMGSGITLESHKVQDGPKGSRECITVFRLPDLNGFQYQSPWLAYLDYGQNNAIRWEVIPMYKSRPYGGPGTGGAGSVSVQFTYGKKQPAGESRETPDAPLVPLNAQVFRELSPVFKDVLHGLQLKLTFECYAPVHYGPNPRGRGALAKSVDIVNVTDKDLDAYGYNFFENEEIMLDLVRWDLGSPDVAEHLKNYGSNLTMPVFTLFGSKHMWHIGYDGNAIYFPPTRQLFDRFFAGKKLDFAQWQASAPDKHVLAEFEQVGYKPRTASSPAPAPQPTP